MTTRIIQESPLAIIPAEIFLDISEYLDPTSVGRLCRTCSAFNDLISINERYWRVLYTHLSGSTETNLEGYKQAVINFCRNIIQQVNISIGSDHALALHGENSWGKLIAGTNEQVHERINLLISELIPSSLPEDAKRSRTVSSGNVILAFNQLGQLDPVHTPTLFLTAARQGRTNLVKTILDSIALPPELMIEGLSQAIFFQKYDPVELLLERQQLNDQMHAAAFLRAAQSGQIQMLKFIQERLGSFSSQNIEQTTRGQAVVNAIIYNQDNGLVKYLLDTGPIDTESYDRAIEIAAEDGKIEIMRHLIHLDPPQGSIFEEEHMRQSAMEEAIENSHKEIFTL